MNTLSKLREKLADPDYRTGFVESQINIGIPFQIRALLKSRPGWTQETLAGRAGMLQPRISGLMTPGKTRPNIETLRRIAEAFDCALMVRFVPFSELARWSKDFDPETFNAPSFQDDIGFEERKPMQRAETGGTWSTVDRPGIVVKPDYLGRLIERQQQEGGRGQEITPLTTFENPQKILDQGHGQPIPFTELKAIWTNKKKKPHDTTENRQKRQNLTSNPSTQITPTSKVVFGI